MSYTVKTFAAGTYQNFEVDISGEVFCPLDSNLDGCAVQFNDQSAGKLTIGANGIRQFKMPFQRFFLNGTISQTAQLVIATCGTTFPQVALPLNPAPAELDAIAGTAVVTAKAGSLSNPAIMVGGFSSAGYTPEILNLDSNGMVAVGVDGAAVGGGAAGLRSLNASSSTASGAGEWGKALLMAGATWGGNPLAGGISLAAGQTVNFNASDMGKGFRRLKVYWNAGGAGLVIEAQYNQAPHTGAWITIVDGTTAGALAAGEYCYISDGTANGTSEALQGGAGMKLLPAPCMAFFNFRVRNASASAFTLTWLQWEVESF